MGSYRKPHLLKPLKRSEMPSEVIFVDTETRSTRIEGKALQHTLRLGVGAYWRRYPDRTHDTVVWKEFMDSGVFWEWVFNRLRPKGRLFVVAHNVQFDLPVLHGWRYIREASLKPELTIYDAGRVVLSFSRRKARLMILDNMNFFQTSLAVLGERMGLKKLPMPEDNASMKDWFTYCRRDVEVLLKTWQEWIKFLRAEELGDFGFTIASQSMKAFRTRFLKQSISIHTSRKAIRLERMAYRGGRTECFFIGQLPKDNYSLFDVNSMYPFVMAKYEYPFKLLSTGGTVPLSRIKQTLVNYAVIAHVDVETTDNYIGYHQMRNEAFKVSDFQRLDFDSVLSRRQRLIFPTGRFTVTLTSQELEYALARGDVKRVHAFAVYQKAKLFDRFVDYFYKQRLKAKQQKDEVYTYLYKLILNSLYGKFGQRTQEWVFVDWNDPTEYWTRTVVTDEPEHLFRVANSAGEQKKSRLTREPQTLFKFRCIMGKVEFYKGWSEGYNALVAIPAEITANARLFLHELIREAGPENVFYCDTDSVIVNQKGTDQLEHRLDSSQIGALGIENSSTNVQINNLKDYQFGDIRKIKGVKKDAEEIRPNVFKQFRSRKLASLIKSGNPDLCIWDEVEKTYQSFYHKGTVDGSGKVSPLRLDRDSEGLEIQVSDTLF